MSPRSLRRPSRRSGTALLATIVAAIPASGAGDGAEGGRPDLVIGEIAGFVQWADAEHRAYAVGRDTCNRGDAGLGWEATTPLHPVTAQHLYRLHDGRFEQIGLSWLQHGFCALNLTTCDACPARSGCATLAPLCATANAAGRAGSQRRLGPRSEVDATTGVFPFPPASPPYSGVTDRRLRVRRSDVEAARHPGAAYFIEVQSAHAQDAPADGPGSRNNVSYRAVALAPDGAMTALTGPTVVGEPALRAWAAVDPTVAFETVEVPGEGTLHVASSARDVGGGMWAYEYAVHNLDLDRGVRGFAVPLPAGVAPRAIGFHDVDHHSGEIWDTTDWPATVGGDEVAWRTTLHVQDPTANAIRWGTQYNFRFRAAAPPGRQAARLELFAPGLPAAVSVSVLAPVTDCVGDVDGDGIVGFGDLLAVLSSWGPCAGCPEDVDGSGAVGFADALLVLGTWGPCG